MMKKILALVLVLMLAAYGAAALAEVPSGVEDGVLTVAMECTYAPYNWTQPDDSNGAVPISNNPGMYANGYDVMTAKAIAEANGWQLEIVQQEWESLIPAVQTGMVDAVIAGQSMTKDRMEQVDFAGPYLYATIVCVTKKDSPNASAKGISELTGHATSQISTVWDTTCLPQVKNAVHDSPKESAPAMIVALESGMVDFICCDMPTALGALAADNDHDLVLLDFNGTEDNFVVSEEEINIGISLQKGNTVLLNAINEYLKDKTEEDFNALMAQAIEIAPQ